MIYTAEDQVILVDESGQSVGFCDKLAAHQEALLHRAFSIFLFDQTGRCLLQKRHFDKYHSGGLWSNACCSHPRPGEDTKAAAHRRLDEEMGIQTELQESFSFIYQYHFESGLVEYEYDHVFLGCFDGKPFPAPQEVEAWRWVHIDTLNRDVTAQPEKFSYWMRACLPKVLEARNRSTSASFEVPHFELLAV